MKNLLITLLVTGLLAPLLGATNFDTGEIQDALRRGNPTTKLLALKALSAEIQERARQAVDHTAAVQRTRDLLEPFTPVLIAAADDPHSGVRANAVRILGYCRPSSDIESLLAEKLGDPVPDVQYAVLASVYYTKADNPQLRRSVLELLEQRGNSNLFRDASKLATAWQMASALRPLTSALGSSNHHFRLYASVALADMGAVASIPDVRMALEGVLEPTLRQGIEKALARLEQQQAAIRPIGAGVARPQEGAGTRSETMNTATDPTTESYNLLWWVAVVVVVSMVIVIWLRTRGGS